MCWSGPVSLSFALAECLLLVFVIGRAVYADDYYIRAQLLFVPIMLSIIFVELTKFLIWQDERLMPITSVDDTGQTCSRYNQALTIFVEMALIPWQPLSIIMVYRRVHDKSSGQKNYDIFLVPEVLAAILGVAFVMNYFVCQSGMWSSFWSSQNPLHKLQDSGYKGYHHYESCTFIGLNGHLHWVSAAGDTYFSPNGFAYHLLVFCGCFSRPRRMFAPMVGLAQCIFVFFFIRFEGSFECGSLWCWSGIMLHIFMVVQPYLLPASPKHSCSRMHRFDFATALSLLPPHLRATLPMPTLLSSQQKVP